MLVRPVECRAINQFCDAPYRDAFRNLKGGFEPSRVIAESLETTSTCKILLSRAVRVLTGLVLLIPVLNIIVDIALRKLMSRANETQGVEEEEEEEQRINSDDDLRTVVDEIIKEVKPENCEKLTYKITMDSSAKNSRKVTFKMKFKDRKDIPEHTTTLNLGEYSKEIERDIIRSYLKFDLLTQGKGKEYGEFLNSLFPGKDSWKPEDVVSQIDGQKQIKEGSFPFLEDGIKKWNQETQSPIVINEHFGTVGVKDCEGGSRQYNFTFEVGKNSKSSFIPINMSLKAQHDKGWEFDKSKQKFVQDFIFDAWRELYG